MFPYYQLFGLQLIVGDAFHGLAVSHSRKVIISFKWREGWPPLSLCRIFFLSNFTK